jgi:hypothetical protein
MVCVCGMVYGLGLLLVDCYLQRDATTTTTRTTQYTHTIARAPTRLKLVVSLLHLLPHRRSLAWFVYVVLLHLPTMIRAWAWAWA